MDNDPPPSYNSVVEGESGQYRISSGPAKARRKTSETGDTKEPCETSRPDNDSEGQPEQRVGLWTRFKKSLEDFALFVIQVLD